MIPKRIRWPKALAIGKRLVEQEQAEVGLPPGVRRLHYLMVTDAEAIALGYTNKQGVYQRLSNRTAEGRRDETFPDLMDQTRRITGGGGWEDGEEALGYIADTFTLDRRPYMKQSVLIVAEKAGILPLLKTQFSWMDLTSLNGYGSQTLKSKIRLGQFDLILYLGDFDPSGLDIERDLKKRTCLPIYRVLVTEDQIDEYSLPEVAAKKSDTRTKKMIEMTGRAIQVELDAMPSTVILSLLREAVSPATGLSLDSKGFPILPAVDTEEEEIQAAIRRLSL